MYVHSVLCDALIYIQVVEWLRQVNACNQIPRILIFLCTKNIEKLLS